MVRKGKKTAVSAALATTLDGDTLSAELILDPASMKGVEISIRTWAKAAPSPRPLPPRRRRRLLPLTRGAPAPSGSAPSPRRRCFEWRGRRVHIAAIRDVTERQGIEEQLRFLEFPRRDDGTLQPDVFRRGA